MASLLRYIRQADLLLLAASIVVNLAIWLWWRSSFDLDVRYAVNTSILLAVNTVVVLAIRSRWYLAALAFAGVTFFWGVATLVLFYHVVRGI